MNHEELLELHRRWIWAGIIRKQFIQAGVGHLSQPIDLQKMFVTDYGCYMSLWYGLLFVVLEGLRRFKITVEPIQNDIESIYGVLKLYRNGTFHPQKDYWSPRMFKIAEDPNSAKKIWAIHDGLGEYFLQEFAKRKSA